MAAGFNKVFLMGNLTRDVEVKRIGNDQAVANIGLAVNRRFRTKDGEARDEVTFVDCEAWGRTAETMAQYLSKGRPVFIEGRLRMDQWQDKESGANRTKMKVVVEEFRFVDSRGGGEEGGAGGARPGGARAQGARSAPASSGGPGEPMYEPLGEEDIPF